MWYFSSGIFAFFSTFQINRNVFKQLFFLFFGFAIELFKHFRTKMIWIQDYFVSYLRMNGFWLGLNVLETGKWFFHLGVDMGKLSYLFFHFVDPGSFYQGGLFFNWKVQRIFLKGIFVCQLESFKRNDFSQNEFLFVWKVSKETIFPKMNFFFSFFLPGGATPPPKKGRCYFGFLFLFCFLFLLLFLLLLCIFFSP